MRKYLTIYDVDSLLPRFEKGYKKTTSGLCCWIWMKATDVDGYGRIRYMDTHMQAHRVAYYLYRGPLKPGKVVMHLCDNPRCVNPFHLHQGTNKDNHQDSARKGRRSGKKNPNYKHGRRCGDNVTPRF